ncbi:MAG: hypothetical protein QXX41_07635 [Nitrososphaerota archaeon]
MELELEKIVEFDNARCFDYLSNKLNIPELLLAIENKGFVELPIRIKSYKVTLGSIPKLMSMFDGVEILKKSKYRDVWIRLLRHCFVVAKTGSSLSEYSKGEEFKSRLQKNRFAIRFMNELLKRELVRINDRNLFEYVKYQCFGRQPGGKRKWEFHRCIYRDVFPLIKIVPNFPLLEGLSIYIPDEWTGLVKIQIQGGINVDISFGKERLLIKKHFEHEVDERLIEAIGYKIQWCFQYFAFSRWAQYLEKHLQEALRVQRVSLESIVFNVSKLVPPPPEIRWLVEFNLRRKHFTEDMSKQLELLREVEMHASELGNLRKIIESYVGSVAQRFAKIYGQTKNCSEI